MPLFIGVNLQKELSDDKFQWKDILDSVSKISEPMMELSVLQGLSSTLKSASYSNTDKLTAVLSNSVVSYFTQAIPTLGGQIARTTDRVQRTTYIDKNSVLPAVVDRTLQQTEKKIPFLSSKLQPKIDLWGREVYYSDNAGARAVSNFLSPGYFKKENITSVDKKILALHKVTGDNKCIPSAANKKITLNKQDINLTSSEYTEFAKLKGQKSYNKAKELMSGKTTVKLKDNKNKTQTFAWDKMNNDQRVQALQKVYTDANNEARDEIAKKHYPKEYKKVQEANKKK